MEPLPEMSASSSFGYMVLPYYTEILPREDVSLGGVEVNGPYEVHGSHEVQEEYVTYMPALSTEPLLEMNVSSFIRYMALPQSSEILPREDESLGGVEINGAYEVHGSHEVQEEYVTYMPALSTEPLLEMNVSSFIRYMALPQSSEILPREDESVGGVEINGAYELHGSHEVQEEHVTYILALSTEPLPEMYSRSFLDDESDDA